MTRLKLRLLSITLCWCLSAILSACDYRLDSPIIVLEIDNPSRVSFHFLSVEVDNDDCVKVRATGTGPNRLVEWMPSSYAPQWKLLLAFFQSNQALSTRGTAPLDELHNIEWNDTESGLTHIEVKAR